MDYESSITVDLPHAEAVSQAGRDDIAPIAEEASRRLSAVVDTLLR